MTCPARLARTAVYRSARARMNVSGGRTVNVGLVVLATLDPKKASHAESVVCKAGLVERYAAGVPGVRAVVKASVRREMSKVKPVVIAGSRPVSAARVAALVRGVCAAVKESAARVRWKSSPAATAVYRVEPAQGVVAGVAGLPVQERASA